MDIYLSDQKNLDIQDILPLYEANEWSSAQKPELLHKALNHSHSLISAWHGKRLVGLGNAISDGYLMVYYPHLLVHPAYHGKGIGGLIVARMQEIYGSFHMQMLTADGKAIAFYEKNGFSRAGETAPMWIYEGKDH
ncbi:MAG: GNAT family N-acetyltransferase [Bacteroidota bacterium]